MKTNYTFKTFLFLGLLALTFQISEAQIRIVEVDPATSTVKLHNFGSAQDPLDISSYWFCARFDYTQVSDGTIISGSTNLAVGADLVLTLGSSLDATSSDLGLYTTPSFSSSAAMEDFMQYGAGGIGRENVAVAKGIWTSGTFINIAPPYEYGGDGNQNGFQFWDTLLLSVDDFNLGQNLKLYPNPSNDILNIDVKNGSGRLDYQVYDVLGKLVISDSIQNSSNTAIDVSNLDNGLYLINLSYGNQSETKRFIKQ
ncbi:T9SS type A sorting domain-containing protein [Psychroserpens sp.]|uniref:T9SS type A sorting domain-containing protein n=1 Tax=Psychroserpens sp. TaxID=2020870 RepID=UPI00385F55DE